MTTNKSWKFIEPNARLVYQAFRDLTPEQATALRDNAHVLYYALEHLRSVYHVTDEHESRRRMERAQAQAALLKKDD